MEGKFDEEGHFSIKRGGRWQECSCPFTKDIVRCGDWCPQVSEPIRQTNPKLDRAETIVHICQARYWKFTTFEDKRKL